MYTITGRTQCSHCLRNSWEEVCCWRDGHTKVTDEITGKAAFRSGGPQSLQTAQTFRKL